MTLFQQKYRQLKEAWSEGMMTEEGFDKQLMLLIKDEVIGEEEVVLEDAPDEVKTVTARQFYTAAQGVVNKVRAEQRERLGE